MVSFEFSIIGSEFNAHDDNVDVEIKLDNGEVFYATFFTIANIESLFKKNRDTGECKDGLYLWASDMILVEKLSEPVIRNTIDDLIKTGELGMACSKQ